MVKAWTALHRQTLMNLLSRPFKMSILRQLHHIFTVRQVQVLTVGMAVKMSYVVAMCRRGVLNSKSKRLFAIWPLTYYPRKFC